MADEFSVPPEVLETFLKIKRLAEAMVDQLQTPPLGPSVSVIARPETVRAKAHIPTPVVGAFSASLPMPTVAMAGQVSEVGLLELPTVDEVRMARAWVEAMKAAKLPLEIVGVSFTVWQLAELLLKASP